MNRATPCEKSNSNRKRRRAMGKSNSNKKRRVITVKRRVNSSKREKVASPK